MYFLIYVSSAAEPFSQADLEALLVSARENNMRLDITGMLLYKDGNFMQLLEGPREAITSVHQQIMRDPRHRGLITLIEGESQTRDFQNWSMGFRDLRTADNERVPGYSDFLNTSLIDSSFKDNPSRAKKLLLAFKRSM